MSRKNLSFIHFVARIRAVGIDVAEAANQRAVGLDVAFAASVSFEPFAENAIQGFVLGPGELASPLDKVRVSAEGHVFHEFSVHDLRVVCKLPLRGRCSRSEADGGEEAAGAGALLAVAEEEVGAAGGAEIADEDIVVEEADGKKLRAVGLAEIEADVFGGWLVAGRGHIEPLERVGFFSGARLVEPVVSIGELGAELGDELGPDFVAAGADGRTECSEKIRRL